MACLWGADRTPWVGFFYGQIKLDEPSSHCWKRRDYCLIPYSCNLITVMQYYKRGLFMTSTEVEKLQRYLRHRFGNNDISLVNRPETGDSVEFQLNGETFGTVYRDDEDDDVCYNINIIVLSEDLD
jgi:hypothetical protein